MQKRKKLKIVHFGQVQLPYVHCTLYMYSSNLQTCQAKSETEDRQSYGDNRTTDCNNLVPRAKVYIVKNEKYGAVS